MTVNVDTTELLRLAREVHLEQELGIKSPGLYWAFQAERRQVHLAVVILRQAGATYRLDEAAEPFLDPMIVKV
jgi:hypothetical protein